MVSQKHRLELGETVRASSVIARSGGHLVVVAGDGVGEGGDLRGGARAIGFQVKVLHVHARFLQMQRQ